MPYALDRLVDYSAESLAAELRRVAALVDHPVLTAKRFRAMSRVSHHSYLRRFGTWRDALEAVGLAHRYGGPRVTAKMRAKAARRMSDGELLDLLRSVARPDGTVTTEDVAQKTPVTWLAYRARFGSWGEAVRRAGLRQSPQARLHDDRECLENLRLLWTHYGRAPRFEEAARPPSRVGPAAYLRRWRSWNRAIHAFVAWANAGRRGDDAPALKGRPPRGRARGTKPGASRFAPEDRRHIPMHLRFKVLERDGFRCVACGDSPALTRGVKLHIDHIEPWSKGGKSTPDNLRTLCAACNHGKGARRQTVPLPSATTPRASRGPAEGGARRSAAKAGG